MSDSCLPGRAICAKVSGDGLITSSVPSRASASDSSSLSSIGSSLYDLPVMPLCVNMLFLLAASWMAVVTGCSRLLANWIGEGCWVGTMYPYEMSCAVSRGDVALVRHVWQSCGSLEILLCATLERVARCRKVQSGDPRGVSV